MSAYRDSVDNPPRASHRTGGAPGLRYFRESRMDCRPSQFEVHRSVWQWFFRPGIGNFCLECVKLGLAPQAELVHQYSRVLIGIGIFDRIIHAVGQPLRWLLIIARRRCSAVRFLLRASLARFSIAGVSLIPSTSLILAKRSLPSTKWPDFAPFVGSFFCLVIAAGYHESSFKARTACSRKGPPTASQSPFPSAPPASAPAAAS